MFVEIQGKKLPFEDAILYIYGEKEFPRAQRMMNDIYLDYHRFLIQKRAVTDFDKAKATHEFMDSPNKRIYQFRQGNPYKALREWKTTGILRANCVGYTAIYSMLCSYSGLEVNYVSPPLHAMGMIYIDKPIFIEATSPSGFDYDESKINRMYEVRNMYALISTVMTQSGLNKGKLGKIQDEMREKKIILCKIE